ncbi:MAG: bifunctional folylpolyglutamate synthase/dihydrofolate synthase [Chloroflexi bacterium]|nr:bifunctional folylpolyglutamate synthase/dihydrofolate synthase [Chloroflexota bacterium]
MHDESTRAYVEAVRGLLGRGGFERTGNPQEAKRFRVTHIRDFLDRAGRPEERRTVHVAGSKGKGSTAAMVESILRAAGAHTLLLTSPDVHQARERVRIDGEPLEHATFARLAQTLLDDEVTEGWSYFELVTVLGWLAGAEAGCDWQVLEVGLGGRLDTTNVIARKDVAMILPIDLEHTAILGDTIPEVAAEKAGILTGPCEAVVAPLRESAIGVVRTKAAEAGARLHEVADECALRVTGQSLDGQTLDLRTPLRTYRRLQLPLIGRHQAENAAAAVLAAELAWASTGEELPASAVPQGLAGVVWPGRFDVLRRRPLIVADALHTPLAATRFRETVDALALRRPRVLVTGLLGGRDASALAQALLGPDGEAMTTVVVTAPSSQRAADLGEVEGAFRAEGAPVQRAPDVATAVDLAQDLAGEDGTVLVTGSLYTVSEAREHILGVTGDRAYGLR